MKEVDINQVSPSLLKKVAEKHSTSGRDQPKSAGKLAVLVSVHHYYCIMASSRVSSTIVVSCRRFRVLQNCTVDQSVVLSQ